MTNKNEGEPFDLEMLRENGTSGLFSMGNPDNPAGVLFTEGNFRFRQENAKCFALDVRVKYIGFEGGVAAKKEDRQEVERITWKVWGYYGRPTEIAETLLQIKILELSQEQQRNMKEFVVAVKAAISELTETMKTISETLANS